MKEESGHIIYTAADIHQYLTGKLTPAEMHAMEKAALNDPLLADAMDGFAASPLLKNEENFSRLQNDLNNLRKKINTNSGNAKYNSWWKIAASAIIITGSCFAFYTITNHNDKQKEADVLQQPVIKSSPAKDTLSSAIMKADNTSTTIKEDNKTALPEKNKEAKKPTPIVSNTFATNEPVPASSGIEMDENKEEKKAAPVESTLKRSSLNPNKILLKKDKDIADSTGPRSHVEILYKKGATPIIGWSAYLNYLETQLSYSTYDNGEQVSGETIVQFKIDSTFNATPSEFYFEKSINTDVNDAVKDLIQKQGQWKTDNNSTQGIIKLKIVF